MPLGIIIYIHRFQVHTVCLKLSELVMGFIEQSVGLCACLYGNRALRHQYIQALNKAQLLCSPMKMMTQAFSQSLVLENISLVQYGRQSANSPRILSSASIQTATVSCWMGISSSTVLQYFNRII